MALIRKFIRLALMALVTSVLFSLWIVSRVLLLVSANGAHRAHRACVGTWARLFVRIMGVRLSIRGTAPKPPFFLVANHQSYLDIFVLLASADGFFVAKSEIASWPLLGFLARATGTEFVNRKRKSDVLRANDRLEALLREGRGVILFPEGVSTIGEQLQPFKPPLFEAAIRTSMPVTSASVSYRTPADLPPAHESVSWWGDMPFVPHFLKLLGLRRIDATLHFGDEPVNSADRKELAELAHHAVLEHFVSSKG